LTYSPRSAFSGFGRTSAFSSSNVKGKDSHIKALSGDLEILSSLVDVPEDSRVCPSCSIAILILIQYVQNSGIRHNCLELVMNSMLLSEMMGALTSTLLASHLAARRALHLQSCYRVLLVSTVLSSGQHSADQEDFIDKLSGALCYNIASFISSRSGRGSGIPPLMGFFIISSRG
jgi:hypothetical protein